MWPCTKNVDFIKFDGNYSTVDSPNDIEVLIVRQGLVKKELFSHFKNIKWLQLLNSGYEQINLDLLRGRNIIFTNARSVYCQTIAEDVLTKILVLARGYARIFANQQKHLWQPNEDNVDISGRTLGIVGTGSIGCEIAKRTAAFDMHILGYDINAEKKPDFYKIYNCEDGLIKMLSESNFVVYSIPTTPETVNMVNKKTLCAMKKSAFLINVSRGDILNQEELLSALKNHVIRGASIDVTTCEPLPADDPLWEADNLVITPHQAAYGDLMVSKMCGLIHENIQRYVKGQPLLDLVRI